MQLAPLTSLATSPAPLPSATAGASAAAATGPDISGGVTFRGNNERFAAFTASATAGAYGAAGGYDTLQGAIDDLTWVTVGVRQPAAGVFELEGRFYGRQLDNEVTFASGKTWKGMWRLEQHPADGLLLREGAADTTRTDALRAVVDGAQRILVSHLPVA